MKSVWYSSFVLLRLLASSSVRIVVGFVDCLFFMLVIWDSLFFVGAASDWDLFESLLNFDLVSL